MRPFLPRLSWGACLALLLAAVLLAHVAEGRSDDRPAYAFIGIWQGIVAAASWIWRIGSKAVTVAIKAMITALQWAVTNLTRLIVAGLKKTAVFLARTAKATWRLIQRGLKATLRALDKAYHWLKNTLDNIFSPILDFLERVRVYIRDFYRKYVRPVLEAIEITRRVFQLLGYFGLDWAKAIDKKLQQLEDIITYPFDWVVAKLNETISWVNRIATLDGLLQRVTLLRSLLRDFQYTTNMFLNGLSQPISAWRLESYTKKPKPLPVEAAIDDMRGHFSDRSSELSPLIDEVVASLRLTWQRGRR